MSKENSPDADDQLPEKRSSQQLLSLLLLLLIILFGYLYFFTGVIKPREEQPKPQPVAEAPVKTPIPPRPAAGEKGGEAKVAQGEAGKGGAAQAPGKPGAPAKEAAAKPAAGAKEGAAKDHAAKEAPAAKGAPAAKEAAKAAPGAKEAAKPAPGAKEAAKTPGAKEAAAGKPAAPGAKPAAPASQAKPATAQAKPGEKPAQAKAGQPAGAPAKEAKAAVTGKPGAEKAGAAKKGAEKSAEKPGTKGAAVAKAGEKPETAAKGAAKPKAVAKGAYTLELSDDLAENEIPSVLAKLKKAGITQVVKTKSQKGEEMHRLYLADFANRDEAVEELERLKLAAPSAFMLRENGRYAVYAGSYLRDAKASMEQNRLQGKGVQTVMKSANAPVSIMKLRAGSFADQAGAEKAAKSLKKAGLSTKVVRLAKAEK